MVRLTSNALSLARLLKTQYVGCFPFSNAYHVTATRCSSFISNYPESVVSAAKASNYMNMLEALEKYQPGAAHCFEESVSGNPWTPLFRQDCTFPPEIFRQVMLNLIRNPNINSSHVFRADISSDRILQASDVPADSFPTTSLIPARTPRIEGYELKRIMVRTLIPRNILVDKPLDQTCLFHEQVTDSGMIRSLVTYHSHISSPDESPFYHPAVRGVGFLHEYDKTTQMGSVSLHFSFFKFEDRSAALERVAQHLLAVLLKHGRGIAAGYVKRVNHDTIIPQATVQNTYARLKAKYAKSLIAGWVEVTDPGKHVFEDLNIAAFLIELWAEVYKGRDFPGFVDIGCGNGLLVHILLEEGYSGWGFDARRRKSWATYSLSTQEKLKELVLIPSILQPEVSNTPSGSESIELRSIASTKVDTFESLDSVKGDESAGSSLVGTHDGIFPKDTFIISNHADELTPWTPILANISQSPFMMIPCCSHALSGARFRASAPKGTNTTSSAYASFVLWVSKVAAECGWEIEKEMLRIPSTRNAALIGRRRTNPYEAVDLDALLGRHGGAQGWRENAIKLVKGATRGH